MVIVITLLGERYLYKIALNSVYYKKICLSFLKIPLHH